MPMQGGSLSPGPHKILNPPKFFLIPIGPVLGFDGITHLPPETNYWARV
jgi:hypothetical protein